MLSTDRMIDLIRIGSYTQLEGNFIKGGNRNNYRFRFYSNQIEDIAELLSRVAEAEGQNVAGSGLVLSISSKDLYDRLVQLGFYRFGTSDWNIPRVSSFGLDGRKEYLRAVIDSIGNVDVKDGTLPYVQLCSVNEEGLKKISEIFGGKMRGPYEPDASVYLAWYGKDALAILESLDFKFYNRRNQRGAELIRAVRWSDYLL